MKNRISIEIRGILWHVRVLTIGCANEGVSRSYNEENCGNSHPIDRCLAAFMPEPIHFPN